MRTSIREAETGGKRSVAIIVTAYDRSPFIADALRSCIQQSVRPAEITLVDGRSDDDAERGADAFPGVVVHRRPNADQPDAERGALEKIFSEFVILLDAADRLTPSAVEAGLCCFDANPDAFLVCGAHRVINATGRPVSALWRERLDLRYSSSVQRGVPAVALRAALMHRTEQLRCAYGFNASSELGQKFDLSVSSDKIATHNSCVAEYRYDRRLMLARAAVGREADEAHTAASKSTSRSKQGLLFHHTAPQVFATAAKELVSEGWNAESAKMMIRAAKMAPIALLTTIVSRSATAIMRRLPRRIGQFFGEGLWAPGVGHVRFGDFGRTKPISADYGSDRGTPIDRYYIEHSLEQYSEMVRGRVLEVGERIYTQRFGAQKVVSSDVLDINPLNPAATIVGDLGNLGALPAGAFDCIILTQTLQLIYNTDIAIDNLHQALAPGGALLITVPGISPIGPDEISYWCWTFTALSLKTMLSVRFGENNVEVKSYGNVFAAICFLTGLSLAEVGTERLDYEDGGYPVTVFACARKAG